MWRLLALTLGVLLHSCTLSAQKIGSGSAASAILPRPCHDAGHKSCCPGRNDSCLGEPATCYCDEFCFRYNIGDCCDDLTMGLLRCDEPRPECAKTLEEQVRGLAEIQTALAETYVGLPDHFATINLYLQTLSRQVMTNLFIPFDSNSNDVLDPHEFHLMYVALLSETKVKDALCEDDFLHFCDGNQNGSVELNELEQCTGVIPYCDTPDDTAVLLASELLVSQLQPVFADPATRDQFMNSIFPYSDREQPKDLLSMHEFTMFYMRTIELYNVLPSVCAESVFELCNTDSDQFISLEEVISCGSNGS